jgi:hypothetical protein
MSAMGSWNLIPTGNLHRYHMRQGRSSRSYTLALVPPSFFRSINDPLRIIYDLECQDVFSHKFQKFIATIPQSTTQEKPSGTDQLLLGSIYRKLVAITIALRP